MNEKFDVDTVRKDFPILQTQVRGKPLVYFDNAATSLKPLSVIDTVRKHYLETCSNVHRGVHYLSEQATEKFEGTRKKVRAFLNAPSTHEIIFTRGVTDSINLLAQSFGRQKLGKDDEIIISHMEHHSNIVPWQMLCEQIGCRLKIIPVTDSGEIRIEDFQKLLSPRTKLVSIVYVSNSLGTINPVPDIITLAHQRDIPVIVDAAQTINHMPIDVQALDCDFLTFSAHKIYGPTGVGVLFGKEKWLDAMPPYAGGGDMIASVSFEKTTYNVLPYKFEAGTPNIAGVIGLGAAIEYVQAIGLNTIQAYEHELLEYGTRALSAIPGLRLMGTAENKTSIFSFTVDDIHAHDIGTIVDEEGVAIRTGHHCTMPLMKRFNVPATARASLAFYNTTEEIDTLVKAIHKAKKVFA